MITNLQAKVIYELYREQGVQIGQSFTPGQFFPGVDEQSSRLAVESLALEGYLGTCPARRDEPAVWLEYGNPKRIVMTPEALAAYDEWARAGAVMASLSGPSTLTPALSQGKRGM